MHCKFSTGLRTLLGTDEGFASAFERGILEVYDGPPPANADAPVQGNLLGRVTADGGAFTPGEDDNGLLFAGGALIGKDPDQVWGMTGILAGTAGWARLKANEADAGSSSTDAVRCDFDIANAGAAWVMANTRIEVGGPTLIQAFALTMPGA